MGLFGKIQIPATVVLVATFCLTACLEVQPASEFSTAGTNSSDFSVVTDPSNDNTPTPPADGNTGPADLDSYIGFTINNGQTKTSASTLQIAHYPPFFSWQSKISYGNQCVGGTWEDYASTSEFISTQVNQVVTLSTQYRDRDGRVSDCYTQQIIIDQAGPNILFKKYPLQTVQAGETVQLIFEVTDLYSDVAEVTCVFQGVQKACAKGTNTVTIPSIMEGNYSFTVNAKDSGGFSSTQSISWSVTSLYKNMSQKAEVKDNRSVDILFVIDNSGSMQYEQKSMASRVSKFLEVLRGLDYQIAITTTDSKNVPLGDGRFIPLKGLSNQYFITSSMVESTAQKLLSDTLQRPETGDSIEQAIYATTRVVERAVADPTSIYGQFFRSGAQFAVVVISDEDESANGTKNDPKNLLNLIQKSFGGNKAFSFHSIITIPGDKACKNTEGATYAERYNAFSKLTGGIVGSVCAMDYSAQVQGIAEGVRNTLKTITLACSPVVNSFYNIEVLKDGQPYSGKFTQNGLNLSFDDTLAVGKYEVLYSCLK